MTASTPDVVLDDTAVMDDDSAFVSGPLLMRLPGKHLIELVKNLLVGSLFPVLVVAVDNGTKQSTRASRILAAIASDRAVSRADDAEPRVHRHLGPVALHLPASTHLYWVLDLRAARSSNSTGLKPLGRRLDNTPFSLC
jgi:hypothetical protein